MPEHCSGANHSPTSVNVSNLEYANNKKTKYIRKINLCIPGTIFFVQFYSLFTTRWCCRKIAYLLFQPCFCLV